jgi:Spy/CpxP family protein refolding chaperone
MNGKPKFITALAALLLLASAAMAQPGPAATNADFERPMRPEFRGGHGPGFGPMGRFADLDLTYQQQEQLLELRFEFHRSNLTNHERVALLRLKSMELGKKPEENEKQLKKIESELGELRVERDIAIAKHHQKIWDEVLTAEQREQAGSIDELFERPGRPDGRMHRPRHPRGMRG